MKKSCNKNGILASGGNGEISQDSMDKINNFTKSIKKVGTMSKEEIIEKLWQIIDDIDTYSDMAKSDDKLYRGLVERRQKDRWKLPIDCDRHSITIKEE
jgi:hypothetical protein